MRLFDAAEDPKPGRGRAPAFLLGTLVLSTAAGGAYWLAQRGSTPPARGDGQAGGFPATQARGRSSSGSVEVSADGPGTTVYVDGRSVGAAPCRADDLTAGSHKVRVERPGSQPFEQEVHVIPGRTVRIQARFPTQGPRLRIESDVAGASVFLDRKYVGATPLTLQDVSPGPHHLNVSAEGYEMYSETVDVASGAGDVQVRFKEVQLDETLQVVHRHSLGSCEGRLVASPQGLRYETGKKEDAFSIPLASLEQLEADYLKKSLRVKPRGGKTYNFTEKSDNADALLAFQQKLEKARKRIATGP